MKIVKGGRVITSEAINAELILNDINRENNEKTRIANEVIRQQKIQEVDTLKTQTEEATTLAKSAETAAKAAAVTANTAADTATSAASTANSAAASANALVQHINNLHIASIDDNQPTALESTFSANKISTLIDTAISNLINGAPAAYDTLRELADALGNNTNLSETILTEVSKKVDKIDGKGLSTNDFTNAFKSQLESLFTPGGDGKLFLSNDGTYRTLIDDLNKTLTTTYSSDKIYNMVDTAKTNLTTLIDGKSDSGHTHVPTDIITDETNRFISDADLLKIANSRLKNVAIAETDLDAALALKISKIGTGTGSGGTTIQINGAQIDDATPSFSTVYSSNKTNDLINSNIQSVMTAIGNLSDNNFTDAEKLKLSRIEENANYFTLTTVDAAIITTNPTKLFVSQTEKDRWNNTYTVNELDNKFSALTSGMVWKPGVDTYEDLAIIYPTPIKDWAVTLANGETYLYDGATWIKIGSGTTPLATHSVNGLMSYLDKTKLDGIAEGANNYIHPANHLATMIVETSEKKFATAAQLSAIDGLNTTITDALLPYRKTATKIEETDLSIALLETISTAGGTVINDELTSGSLKQTFSSAMINALFTELKTDLATTADIDLLFA